MKVTVKVNEKLCIGSGSCTVIAAENFALNADKKAELKSTKQGKMMGMELVLDVTPAHKKKLLASAMACPSQAITIFDEKGIKIYP